MSENKLNSNELRVVSLMVALVVICGVLAVFVVRFENRFPEHAVKTGGVYVKVSSDLTLHTVDVSSRIPYAVGTILSQASEPDYKVMARDNFCMYTTDAKAGTEVQKCKLSTPRPATPEEIQIWNTSPH